MTARNLSDELRAAEVDQAELEHIVLDHFHSATHPTGGDAVLYPDSKTGHALALIYRDDRLVRIEPGPALTEQDVARLPERVESDLLTSHGSRVGAEILFGYYPPKGHFRYSNIFQILPVPPDAPQPRFAYAEHPFLLEFRFATSPSHSIRTLRRAVAGREIGLLLGALLNGAVHPAGSSARFHWVLLPHDPGTEFKHAYCQAGYSHPTISLERDDFTPADGIPRLPVTDAQTYYTERTIGAGENLHIPSTLTEMLDRFFALTQPDKDKFLRACYWLRHSSVVHSYSRSAAFTALISAVEALVPEPEPEGVCPECGKERKVGPTQAFADFVERFAPQPAVSKTNRKKLYRIRSKLSHGGALLPSDHRAWGASLGTEQVKEWEDSSEAWQVVRIALVNWLASHGTS